MNGSERRAYLPNLRTRPRPRSVLGRPPVSALSDQDSALRGAARPAWPTWINPDWHSTTAVTPNHVAGCRTESKEDPASDVKLPSPWMDKSSEPCRPIGYWPPDYYGQQFEVTSQSNLI